MTSHAQNTKQYQFIPIALWFLFILSCGWVIYKTDFRADLSVFLPPEPSREEAVVVGQLQNGAANRILLVGIEGGDATTLARLAKDLADKLRKNPAFSHVHNGQHFLESDEQALIYKYRYLLSSNMSAELFTPDGLAAALQRNLIELSSASGLMSKSLFMRDPTGEVLALMDQLAQAEDQNIIEGQWFDDRDRRALLLVQLASMGTDIDAQEVALQDMRSDFSMVVQSYKEKNLARGQDVKAVEAAKMLISGPVNFAVVSQNIIKEEVKRLVILAILLITSILLYVLRKPKLLLIGLLPPMTGAAAGIAAVSLGFGSVHAMTIGFGSTLIGEALDYSIYYFLQRSQASKISAGSENNTIFWRTIALGMLTSICGFSAMLFSGFIGLMQLGVFSIVGLLIAAACTRWVLPSLLPVQLQIRDLSPFGGGVQRLIANSFNWRKFVYLLVLCAALLLVVKQDDLWNHDLGGLSPVPIALQDLDGELRVDMGAADLRHMLVLQGQTEEQVLQQCERLLPRLEELVIKGLLKAYQAPCEYLPSQATQQHRQRLFPERAQLEQLLQESSDKLPVTVHSLNGFVDDVDKSKVLPLLQSGVLNETSLGMALSVMLYPVKLDDDSSAYHGLIQLQAPLQEGKAGNINQSAIRAELQDVLDENTILLDLKDSLDNIYKTYLDKMMLYSAVGFMAIAVLLFVALRSLKRTIRVLFPLTCALFVVVALLHLTGVQLNLINVVGFLLVFAVGSNYALFFSAPQSNMTLVSLLLASITTMTGYSILAFSQIPVLQAVGITVGPGVLLAFVFSALLAPVVVKEKTKLSGYS